MDRSAIIGEKAVRAGEFAAKMQRSATEVRARLADISAFVMNFECAMSLALLCRRYGIPVWLQCEARNQRVE